MKLRPLGDGVILKHQEAEEKTQLKEGDKVIFPRRDRCEAGGGRVHHRIQERYHCSRGSIAMDESSRQGTDCEGCGNFRRE